VEIVGKKSPASGAFLSHSTTLFLAAAWLQGLQQVSSRRFTIRPPLPPSREVRGQTSMSCLRFLIVTDFVTGIDGLNAFLPEDQFC